MAELGSSCGKLTSSNFGVGQLDQAPDNFKSHPPRPSTANNREKVKVDSALLMESLLVDEKVLSSIVVNPGNKSVFVHPYLQKLIADPCSNRTATVSCKDLAKQPSSKAHHQAEVVNSTMSKTKAVKMAKLLVVEESSTNQRAPSTISSIISSSTSSSVQKGDSSNKIAAASSAKCIKPKGNGKKGLVKRLCTPTAALVLTTVKADGTINQVKVVNASPSPQPQSSKQNSNKIGPSKAPLAKASKTMTPSGKKVNSCLLRMARLKEGIVGLPDSPMKPLSKMEKGKSKVGHSKHMHHQEIIRKYPLQRNSAKPILASSKLGGKSKAAAPAAMAAASTTLKNSNKSSKSKSKKVVHKKGAAKKGVRK